MSHGYIYNFIKKTKKKQIIPILYSLYKNKFSIYREAKDFTIGWALFSTKSNGCELETGRLFCTNLLNGQSISIYLSRYIDIYLSQTPTSCP